MKRYRDLNLKKLRDDNGLDFAHYTYKKGQCSCCYGPVDMADCYWAKGRKPKEINQTYYDDGTIKSWEFDRPLTGVQYILFKNADNGSGRVTAETFICNRREGKHKGAWVHYDNYVRVYIEWKFPEEKMDKILHDLQGQLGDEYVVIKPKDQNHCIEVALKSRLETDSK